MSHIMPSLIVAISAVFALSSCGKPDYGEITQKMEQGRQLDSGDYDAMIDYVRDAAQMQIPKLREAATFDDVQRIDEEMKRTYPLTDLFVTALFHDYTLMDEEQREALDDIRKSTQEAFDK